MIGDVSWDCSTRRPIVDGKTINPDTGAVQPSSTPIYSGPPSIDLIWQNIHYEPGKKVWTLNRGPSGPTIDKLFIRISRLVGDGYIKLVSVNITEYACVVICESSLSEEEWGRVAWGTHPDPPPMPCTQCGHREVYEQKAGETAHT
jgi:hypothetical protein